MPQSVPLAAFVFGAVLLLISLVSGGFKIFGAEVPGSAGRTARFLSFFIGIILIIVGLTYEENAKQSPSENTRPLTAQSNPPAYMPPTIVAPVSVPQALAMAKINVNWSATTEESMSLLPYLTDYDKAALMLLASTTQIDLHVARIVIKNTGTMPVNVFPQNFLIRSGLTPLQIQIPNHPNALRQTLLNPSNQVQGIVTFFGPRMLAMQALTLSYNDSSVQVSYDR